MYTTSNSFTGPAAWFVAHIGQEWHNEVNLSSGLQLVWIQSFTFRGPIATPRFKILVCPAIYS